MTNKVEQFTQQAINIANDNNHGYSQYNRWGNPDYDCSGLVITVVQNSGIPVKTNGATYTGNMYQAFLMAGFKDVTNSVNLSTGQGLIRGDILLNVKHHTEIYIGNSRNVGARISENGTIHGKPGDQTGQEIRTHKYYNYPWNYVLRYPQNYAQIVDKYINEFAKDVLKGIYGNGQARKDNIYQAVQKEVNNILNGRSVKNNYLTKIAKDVIKGYYGNGQARKDNLYQAVQKEVNRIL